MHVTREILRAALFLMAFGLQVSWSVGVLWPLHNGLVQSHNRSQARHEQARAESEGRPHCLKICSGSLPDRDPLSLLPAFVCREAATHQHSGKGFSVSGKVPFHLDDPHPNSQATGSKPWIPLLLPPSASSPALHSFVLSH